jgi:hypothetical protein
VLREEIFFSRVRGGNSSEEDYIDKELHYSGTKA